MDKTTIELLLKQVISWEGGVFVLCFFIGVASLRSPDKFFDLIKSLVPDILNFKKKRTPMSQKQMTVK